MQIRQINVSLQKSFISIFECLNIFIAMLTNQFWKQFCPWKPTPHLDTKNVVARSTGGPSISVNKWMYVIKPPKYKCSKSNGVCRLPTAVYRVDKIIHESLNAKICWWHITTNSNSARTILAGISVQAHYCVKIQRLNYLR